nr:MAG TPA: Mitochondrial protein Pet20 [Caudoviricetes sp.]
MLVDVNKMVVCLYWSISASAMNHFPEYKIP